MIRSMLFIPGNNEKLIGKGQSAEADALIFDLEDAVSPDQKAAARILVRDALPMPCKAKTKIVRINPADTEFFQEDVKEILKGHPDIIMLPKVSTREDVINLEVTLKEESAALKEEGSEIELPRIMPLIETALGIENAYEIASASKLVVAMLLGAEDLTADLRCKRTREGKEISYARGRIVACGRAAGVEIYDTPFTDTKDMEGIENDAATAKSLGFTGKAAITPNHLEIINRIFSPTPEDIEYAKAVIDAVREGEAQGLGVVALRGKMIDPPIRDRAIQVLEAAEELGLI